MILKWSNTEEAKKIIGERVRLSPAGLSLWGDQAEGRAGTVVCIASGFASTGTWLDVRWDTDETTHDALYGYCSGDIQAAEPTIKQNLFWEEEDK